jgi:predicted RNA-binding protein with PIN domain
VSRSVLVVDGANVVGARPDGWWKDRAGAARRLHEALLVADIEYDVVVLVLEGQAKGGVRAGRDAHVRTVHAPRDGDAAIVAEARAAAEKGQRVVVVTADRALDARVHGVGATTVGPSWLLDHL